MHKFVLPQSVDQAPRPSCNKWMVAELWNGGVVEGNMVDCDGMVELWNGMKWWLVVDWNGGLVVAPDHVCAYRFRWDL